MGKKKIVYSYRPARDGPLSSKSSQFPEPSIDPNTPLTFGNPFLSSIMNGELPHNNELNRAIDKTKLALQEQTESPNLTPQGRTLLSDIISILASLEKIVQEKNQGEKIQDLYKHSRAAKQNIKASADNNPELKAQAKVIGEEVKDVASEAKELALIFLSSGEFRNLIADCLDLVKSLVLTQSANPQPLSTAQIQSESAQQSEELITVLAKLSLKTEYRKAVKEMFTLGAKIKDSTEEIKHRKMTDDQKDHAKLIIHDVRSIIEEFTGHNSLREFFRDVKHLYREMRGDLNARHFLKRLREFILDSVKDPQSMQTQQKRLEAQSIVESAHILLSSGRYRLEIENIVTNGKTLLHRFKSDSVMQEFTGRIQAFAQHLLFDEDGRLTSCRLVPRLLNLRQF